MPDPLARVQFELAESRIEAIRALLPAHDAPDFREAAASVAEMLRGECERAAAAFAVAHKLPLPGSPWQ